MKRISVLKLVIFGILLNLSLLSFANTDNHLQSYKLDSGDKIQIFVFGEEDLTLETRVDNEGKISYPFLNEINVRLLTPRELEGKIIDGLKGRYLVDPKVNITITEYRPFFVNGEVKNPGGYPYQPGLTLRKAVALAGGFTARAAQNKIEVVRNNNSSQATVQESLDAMVLPGDSLTVKQRFF
ncbi:MAG: polysaccharide export protein [Gammaproteobacteria bacterium]|nr:polysaccharide export protein [Gammaproteobacteria bacterium]